MAKLRHIAMSVPDPQQSAKFYVEALGMKVVGEANSATATGVYLSDGTISLALLKYRTDEAAGERGGREGRGDGGGADQFPEFHRLSPLHGGVVGSTAPLHDGRGPQSLRKL